MNRAVARFKGGQGKAFVCFECFGYEKVKLYIIALIILASDVPSTDPFDRPLRQAQGAQGADRNGQIIDE